jgi:hypothetical protein
MRRHELIAHLPQRLCLRNTAQRGRDILVASLFATFDAPVGNEPQ